MPALIYDVNKEYSEYGGQAIFPRPFKKFLEMAVQLKEPRKIVFEEAFIFFKASSDSEEIKELLVRNRHSGHLLIFNFHAIRQIPPFIWDYCNYLNLGKTNDKPKWIGKEYGDTDIEQAYWKLKEDPDKFAKITLNIDEDGI